MIHRLLVAIDQDGAVPPLVTAVVGLVGGAAADATVLHVRERQPRGVALLSRTEAEGLVDRTVSELRKRGIRARGKLRSCLPYCISVTILNVAAEELAEAIVVGTYRRPGIMRWLQGSVSRPVIAKAVVPVFTVPLGPWKANTSRDPLRTHGLPPNVVAPNFKAARLRPHGQ